MFENIIGQEKATSILRAEMEERRLPGSILIHGEPYSGKLSIALEIARVLACEAGSAWGCGCASCEQHRLLTHPGTLLLGSRASLPEIRAAADTLKRTRAVSARYLYVRAVRKLTRRADPQLWEGAETKMRPAYAAAADIEEMLAAIEPPGDLADPEKLDKLLEKVAARASPVVAALPRDNTPIGVLRKAAFWTRFSAAGGGRTIILENADRMMDASRNAILKLLEEPPTSVHLILLSTNPRALISTILSRVRRYPLVPRTPHTAKEVLTRVFRDERLKHESLGDFFREWEGVPLEATTELARLFVQTASSPSADERALTAAYAACQGQSTLDPGGFFREFCRAVVGQLAAERREGTMDLAQITRWSRVTQTMAREQSELNLQPQLSLQATLYALRDLCA